ncbi:MAG: hypothetical protein QOF78_422 [Phycisphaerales bacterium]|nr:hypothetical protein [Phycisphaerales bacterium]
MLSDIDILDAHVHVYRAERWNDTLDALRHTGAQQFVLLDTGHDGHDPHRQQLELALRIKRTMLAGSAYVFGGLDFRGMFDHGRAEPDVPFEHQLQHLIDIGCDGLKLLAGKPDRRKAIGAALDGDVFRPMLELAEQLGFPLLWHVGDPPEFWSERTAPRWARQRGWFYDHTHPPKSQLEAEIANVFRRHPRLRLILPHFFFLADRLDDAARLLEAYPNYMLDLAPGVEMFHHFTARRDDAREFFVRFADRIIFGSDIGLGCGWSRDRGMMIRRFLETGDAIEVPDDPAMTPDDRPPLRGLSLPREVLRLIYAENFRRVVGPWRRVLAAELSQSLSS